MGCIEKKKLDSADISNEQSHPLKTSLTLCLCVWPDRNRKKAQNPLGLELQAAMCLTIWVLKTELDF